MKKIALLLLCVLSVTQFAQKYKTPADILKIMSASSFSYELKKLDAPVETKQNTSDLIERVLYVVQTDSGAMVHTYTFQGPEYDSLQKGERYFTERKYDSAAAIYKKLVDLSPKVSVYYTYYGQALSLQKDTVGAETAYKQAIAVNNFDYLAHWFLADIYLDKRDTANAMKEITHALILNRNNPRIRQSFSRIFAMANHESDLWSFSPVYTLTRTGVNQVQISYKEEWLGYAMARALWEYEPDYKEKMKKDNKMTEDEVLYFEDKECLVNEAIAMENLKVDYKKHPSLRSLMDAINAKMFDEYVLFEVVLTAHPSMAYLQSDKVIRMLQDYIITIRNPKLPG